jgi:hypothetical protein
MGRGGCQSKEKLIFSFCQKSQNKHWYYKSIHHIQTDQMLLQSTSPLNSNPIPARRVITPTIPANSDLYGTIKHSSPNHWVFFSTPKDSQWIMHEV